MNVPGKGKKRHNAAFAKRGNVSGPKAECPGVWDGIDAEEVIVGDK